MEGESLFVVGRRRRRRCAWWSVAYLVLVLGIVYELDDTVNIRVELAVKMKKKKSINAPLGFRSHDGTFKILQVADLHFGNGPLTRCRDFVFHSSADFRRCSDLNSTLFFRRLLQAENPDLIAFTGDNIFGPSATDAAHSLRAAFAPAIEAGIPWAAVLGNHDHESTMDRPTLMFFISLLDYSLSRLSPSDSQSDSQSDHIDGFGNFDLRVVGAPGSPLANTTVLDLLFLDSGDRETVGGVRTYGWIKESQLRWLSRRSRARQVALAFFHIPIPEMREVYRTKTIVGEFQEWVASSSVNSGVLRSLVSVGDVKAVFVGHDHNNDFCGNLEGIWFCYGGGFGYHAYGKRGWARRARVISAQLAKRDNHWGGVETIKTWKRLDDHHLTKIDHQILWQASPSASTPTS